MKRWVVAAKKADFYEIAKRFHITPMLARILRNRDVITDEEINLYLNGTLRDLYSPGLLKDMDAAAAIIRRHIQAGNKIKIVGDYDIDGVCASYILWSGLTRLGADVSVRLPDRIADGYGINQQIIREAKEEGCQLIVTCDNGIAAREQIQYAKELGMEIVVTDHHEIPYEETDGNRTYLLPPADAIVNPKQEDCKYPYKEICGAYVAYKLICYLLGVDYSKWKSDMVKMDMLQSDGNKEVSESEGNYEYARQLLAFAAFATVGDVMPLRDENRIVVKYGIEQMKKTSNIGLNALINVTQIDRGKLSPYYLGFVLGPCINASGRLDSAMKALSLFMCETESEAVRTAIWLKEMNESRKDMTLFYSQYAFDLVDGVKREDPFGHSFDEDKVLVVYLPDCHESLAGIVAGRIKERYYKPAFVLTRSEEGVKGSGRSIEGFHMFEEMSKNRELFTKFGGHKMAAGLSMDESRIEEFRKRMNEQMTLSEEEMTPKVVIDIAMPVQYATKEFANELERLAPYGVGNERPVFAQKHLLVKSIQVIGRNQNVTKMKISPAEQPEFVLDAIYFGNGEEILKEVTTGTKLSVIYCPEINRFRNQETLQLVISDYIVEE